MCRVSGDDDEQELIKLSLFPAADSSSFLLLPVRTSIRCLSRASVLAITCPARLLCPSACLLKPTKFESCCASSGSGREHLSPCQDIESLAAWHINNLSPNEEKYKVLPLCFAPFLKSFVGMHLQDQVAIIDDFDDVMDDIRQLTSS